MNLSDSKLKVIIAVITITIPAVVTLLAYLPPLELEPDTVDKFYILPKINAFINGTAFFVLLGAWVAIRSGKIQLHKMLTSSAVILSILFLVSYITFHFTVASTHYCGSEEMKMLYFFILITHIILSALIVPLVMFTYARGYMMQVTKHKKLAHITWPLWLYVTATGVIVYLMISPCYPV
jgi:putative membrane protein